MLANIIDAIEAKLQAQKDTIFSQKLKIEELTSKLEDAEREIAALKGKGAKK